MAGLTCAFCHTTQLSYRGQLDAYRRAARPCNTTLTAWPSYSSGSLCLSLPTGAEVHKSLKELDAPEPFQAFAGSRLVAAERTAADRIDASPLLAVEAENFRAVMNTDLAARGGRDALAGTVGAGPVRCARAGGQHGLRRRSIRITSGPPTRSVSIPPSLGRVGV
jgi:hypothetical protein